MNKAILIVAATWACALAGQAQARDTRLLLPVDDAIKQGRSEGIIGDDIAFRFGNGNRGGHAKTIGTEVANRKTNALNKSDVEACNWVFLSSLKALQEGARGVNAKAVVEIVSYYKKREFSSATEFECHVGTLMAGVALKGSYAK
ncbi:MAG: excinuclease ABC subunit A [Rhodanobacteraceae bacterium]|nr:excinuclease ABC subunit A [Rhodanobacteraceae bacterium]